MIDNYIFKRIFITIVVLLIPLLIYSSSYEGYFITMEGDTIYATFKIMKAPGTGLPMYAKLQNSIKYKIEKSDKYSKVKACIARKLVMKVDNKYEEFVAASEDSLLKKIDFRKNLLIHRIVQGAVTLYCYYFYDGSSFTTGTGNPGTVMATHSTSTLIKEYILIKEDGNYIKIVNGRKRKYIIEFLKEYTVLAQKIENKEIKTSEIELIVNEYNKWKNSNSESDLIDNELNFEDN